MSAVLNWLDTQDLSKGPEIEGRNWFARKYKEATVDEFLLHSVYLTFDEITRFLRFICEDLNINLSGKGVELGAGCGAVSNALLKVFPGIESIHSVEIVPEIVSLLQPRMIAHAQNDGKCIPVFGSFDELRLPDASLDFAIEFDSYHHSNDLLTTLKETARVLKPGGKVIIIDRVHHNTLSNEQKEYLLSIEYSELFKRNNGMEPGVKVTRRDNGEHEIRRREWIKTLEEAGFTIQDARYYHRRSPKGLLQAFFTLIPFSLRKKLGKGTQWVRPPLRYFAFYLLPFMPRLWDKYYRPLKVKFSGPAAFSGKSVLVAVKQ